MPPSGAQPADAKGKIGTYGCGSIVRVAVPAGVTHPPTTAIVDCPGCGRRHRVAISWRRPTHRDEGREPDLVLDVAPELPDTQPKDPR